MYSSTMFAWGPDTFAQILGRTKLIGLGVGETKLERFDGHEREQKHARYSDSPSSTMLAWRPNAAQHNNA